MKVFDFVTQYREMVTSREVRERLAKRYGDRYIRKILEGHSSYSKSNKARKEILECAESIIKEKAKAVLDAA